MMTMEISGGGGYAVSENGDVYNRHGKKMTQHRNSQGYLRVSLQLKGKGKKFLVHRLVAMAFIENQAGKPQVNHIDGDKGNNDVSNIEWCTQSENMHHAYDSGLLVKNKKAEAAA